MWSRVAWSLNETRAHVRRAGAPPLGPSGGGATATGRWQRRASAAPPPPLTAPPAREARAGFVGWWWSRGRRQQCHGGESLLLRVSLEVPGRARARPDTAGARRARRPRGLFLYYRGGWMLRWFMWANEGRECSPSVPTRLRVSTLAARPRVLKRALERAAHPAIAESAHARQHADAVPRDRPRCHRPLDAPCGFGRRGGGAFCGRKPQTSPLGELIMKMMDLGRGVYNAPPSCWMCGRAKFHLQQPPCFAGLRTLRRALLDDWPVIWCW